VNFNDFILRLVIKIIFNFIGNLNVNLIIRYEKVEHHIIIKIHELITLNRGGKTDQTPTN